MGKQETMIERVARALFARKVEEFVCDGTWEENSALHDEFRADARAAIEAMREPTMAMIEAGVRANFGKTLGSRVTNSFNDMLTAALNEDSGE